MKVTLLNDSFPPVIDGVANVVLNYGKILQTEHLADVMVATPKYPDTDYSGYPYRVVPYQSFDTTKIVKGYRAGNPLDLLELKELVDFHPDIIHTHCPVASTYVARMLRQKVEVPIIFTYHTKFDEDIARAVKNEFIQKETVKVLVNNISACDEIWVVSHGAGENMKSLGYEGDYHVVSNGVDFAKGRVDAATVAEVTKDYDIPSGIPVFLFVGRMISYKGVPFILDACKKLSDIGQDYRMIFVGSGADLDMFKEKARDLGILDNPDNSHPGKCIFTGPIYDRDVLRAWNTRSDLFIFPSTYDTNGIVVREAAACGLASLLIEGSCAAEGITHDRNGFLTQQDADSIFQLLAKVSKDLDHLHQVGQNAMDEIYISWADSVHAAHERYGELIDLQKSGQLRLNTHQHRIADNITSLPSDVEADMKRIFEKSAYRFDNMLDNVEDFANSVKTEAKDFGQSIRTDAKDFSQSVKNEVKDFGQSVKSETKDIKDSVKSEAKEFTNNISTEAKETWRALEDFFNA